MGETSDKSETGEQLDLVVRSIRRTRNKLGCGFILVLGFGIAMIVGGFTSDEAGIGLAIFGAFCVLLAAFGGKMIWPTLNPENAPLVRLLREHPENIAWIYSVADPGARGRSGRTHTITVNDVDKKAHSFMVKAKDLDKMMEILKSFAPRAAVGFTDEFKKQYAQDPWSVISDS